MVGVGVDIVEIARFKSAQYLNRVSELFLTENELGKIPKDETKFQYLASRFAAKEAVLKALPPGTGYYDFEISKEAKKPKVVFIKPQYKKFLAAISLSHSYDLAIAFVVIKRQLIETTALGI